MILETLSLFSTSGPLAVYSSSFGWMLSVQLWGCEGETEEKEREEAKLKLIMPLAYRRCVCILLAISKVCVCVGGVLGCQAFSQRLAKCGNLTHHLITV